MRLREGEWFPSKTVLWMQSAEEANLRGIKTKATRSDLVHLTEIGVDFLSMVHTMRGLDGGVMELFAAKKMTSHRSPCVTD